MKSRILFALLLSMVLTVSIQGQGQGEPSERRTGDVATFDLPGGATIEMVWIEPGTFTMGAPEGVWGGEGKSDPQHEVTITQGFWLGKYELTQGQWESVMGTRPWTGGVDARGEGPNYPAVYISWYDVQDFIAKSNEAEADSVYRLPTEAEWEYACRAGTTTLWSFGDDESLVGEYAWYWDNTVEVGEEYAHQVGTKLPNLWGLYDMHGNVKEWCEDWYGEYSSDSQTDPIGPTLGDSRVARGGAVYYFAEDVASASRFPYEPDFVFKVFGARLLREGIEVGTLGDINQDGLIDVRDVILCLRVIVELPLPTEPAGHTTPTAYETWAADMDEDGKITSGDALQILELAVQRLLSAKRASAGSRLQSPEAIVVLPDQLQGDILPVRIESTINPGALDLILRYDPLRMAIMDVQAAREGVLMIANTDIPGQIKVAIVGSDGITGEDGVLVRVQVKVKGERALEPLQVEQIHLFDRDAVPMQVQVMSGRRLSSQIIPSAYRLIQNHPNPFNAVTMILYELPKAGYVTLTLYILTGQKVATLVSGHQEAGHYEVVWDGSGFANGVYFYRLEAAGFVETKRMVLIK